MHYFIVFLTCFLVASCSSESSDPSDVSIDTVDVGTDRVEDASMTDLEIDDVALDSGSLDVGLDVTAFDVGVDSSSMDVSVDSGGDAQTNVRLTGPATVDFDASYWGTQDEPGTFHIETIADGTGMCPSLSDPAPEANLILNVDNRGDDPVVTAATLVDFGGMILPDDVFRPLEVTVTNFVVDEVAERVTFSMTGADAEGTVVVSGTVVANYCASLDPEP